MVAFAWRSICQSQPLNNLNRIGPAQTPARTHRVRFAPITKTNQPNVGHFLKIFWHVLATKLLADQRLGAGENI